MPSARQRRKAREAKERDAAAALTNLPSLTDSHAPKDSSTSTTTHGPSPLAKLIDLARPHKREHEGDSEDKNPKQQKMKTAKPHDAATLSTEDDNKTPASETLAAYNEWKQQINNHTESFILKKVRKRYSLHSKARETCEQRIKQEDEDHLMFVYKAFIRKFWDNDYMWKYPSVLNYRVDNGWLVEGEFLGALSFPEEFAGEVAVHVWKLQSFVVAVHAPRDSSRAVNDADRDLPQSRNHGRSESRAMAPAMHWPVGTTVKQITSVSDADIEESEEVHATFKLEHAVQMEEDTKVEDDIKTEAIKTEPCIKIEGERH